MMKRIDDMNRWSEAALDTPFGLPRGATTTFYPPGICVKSRDREGPRPKFFGRVVEFDEAKNYALVRSYGSRFDVHGSAAEAGTVWEGTVSDCLKMWEID